MRREINTRDDAQIKMIIKERTFDCELKYRHIVVCAAILSKLSIGNVR